MIRILLSFFALTCTVIFAGFPRPAMADNNDYTQIPPPQIIQNKAPSALNGELSSFDYPMIRLTPDKPQIVRLSRDATNIVVGNDAHLNVIPDTSRTLVLVPRLPGATYFEVLDAQSNVIMGRHVIVAAPKQDYVRVRRACTSEMDDCTRYSVFFCPDMCHEVNVMQEETASEKTKVPEETAARPEPGDETQE